MAEEMSCSEVENVFKNLVSRLLEGESFYEQCLAGALGTLSIRHELNTQEWRHSENYEGIDFDRMEVRCGYLERYAACHYVVAKRSISKVFSSPSCASLQNLLCNEDLQVVSAGGGPGNDLISFCSVLCELTNSVRNLRMTVVDLKDGWRDVFPQLLEDLRTGNFGDVTRMLESVTVSSGFVEADLADLPTPREVQEADLVLMTKVLSVVPKSKKCKILQNIFTSMKAGAYFLFTDTGEKKVKKAADRHGMSMLLFTGQTSMYYGKPGSIPRSTYGICLLQKPHPIEE